MNTPPLLLLHGALGAARQMEPLKLLLDSSFSTYTLDFSGHGNRVTETGDFSIAHFANDVLQWMERQSLNNIYIFGYSMGGYVALYLAKHYPEKVKKIITLATKFQWDEATALKETRMLNAEIIKEKLPHYAAYLEQMHQLGDWKHVLSKTALMMRAMGKDNPLQETDFAGIDHPVLLMLGDKDTMVSVEETQSVGRTLKNARLTILPETPHPINKIPLEKLAGEVLNFFIHP